MVVEGDRSRRNRLFLILLDFSLIFIVVLMQIANFCKQNYLAMTHVDNWWITFFIPSVNDVLPYYMVLKFLCL
jgi:hypothetical protein